MKPVGELNLICHPPLGVTKGNLVSRDGEDVMKNIQKTASELHKDVPPDWYYQSIRENVFQRFWHKRRFREVSKMITPVKGKVLDVGCADGVFTKVILDKIKASQIVGVDVLKTSVNWAKKHWRKSKKMKFMIADTHKLPFKTNSFDAVFSLEMLEHVFEPGKALKEMRRVMKRGGYGIFLVPTESLLFKIVWFLWRFSGRMVWKDAHIQDYRNKSLLQLIKQCGFKIEKSKKFLLGMLHAVKVRK